MPPKGQKRLTKYASRSDSGELIVSFYTIKMPPMNRTQQKD